jgi:hypothetical protein
MRHSKTKTYRATFHLVTVSTLATGTRRHRALMTATDDDGSITEQTFGETFASANQALEYGLGEAKRK